MKKYNRLISTLFSILFIIIFSFYHFDEYKSFHQNKIIGEKQQLVYEQQINNFEIKNITELKNAKFYYTPNKELLEKIVDLINNAKKEIYLETYMLTEKRVQEALIKAYKKGLKVEVILEKSPYMSYNINNKAYDKLNSKGIKTVWSNKSNYSLNHSKILLIDDLSIISTGNYTYSTFTTNRDFFILTYDENINKKLKENFFNDYTGNKITLYDNNLIFSPTTSRIKFEKLFDEANKSIDMYFQYLLDDKLVEKLIKIKKEKKLEITAILPETAIKDENTKKLEQNGIKISIQKKGTMHAKAILIDKKYLYIGSINFSENSIDNNREIGVLIKNKEIINDFLDIFNADLKNNY